MAEPKPRHKPQPRYQSVFEMYSPPLPYMNTEPLSDETLQQTIALVNTEFDDNAQGSEKAQPCLEASLDPAAQREFLKTNSICDDLRYWVAKRANDVIGVTGLYSYQKKGEEDIAWIGWTAVDPKERGKGLGAELYKTVIEEAIKQGKKHLRVYVSNQKEMGSANRMYEKLGFKIVERKPYQFKDEELEIRVWDLDLEEYSQKSSPSFNSVLTPDKVAKFSEALPPKARRELDDLMQQQNFVEDFLKNGFSEGRYDQSDFVMVRDFLCGKVEEALTLIVSDDTAKKHSLDCSGITALDDCRKQITEGVNAMGQNGYTEITDPSDPRIEQMYSILKSGFTEGEELPPLSVFRAALEATENGTMDYHVATFVDNQGKLGNPREVHASFNVFVLKLDGDEKVAFEGLMAKSAVSKMASGGVRIGKALQDEYYKNHPDFRYGFAESTDDALIFNFSRGSRRAMIKTPTGYEPILYIHPPVEFDDAGNPMGENASGGPENLMISDRQGVKTMPVHKLLDMVSRVYQAVYIDSQEADPGSQQGSNIKNAVMSHLTTLQNWFKSKNVSEIVFLDAKEYQDFYLSQNTQL